MISRKAEFLLKLRWPSGPAQAFFSTVAGGLAEAPVASRLVFLPLNYSQTDSNRAGVMGCHVQD